ncbi:MAG TPA: hypothetical protein VLF61_00950 [Rhabdochlamydiaceae bacterium]|nr:hypothetical protein [Rhabdochlamydiaceae bacterium]
MKKTIGGLCALLTSLTMVSAFADCGCGCGTKGKVMGSVANAPAPVVKAAPATPAATTPATNVAPVAKTPVIASKDAKDTKAAVAAPQNSVSAEDDSEEDDE